MEKRAIIYLTGFAFALGTAVPGAYAQRFSLKPHASIGLNKPLNIESELPLTGDKASSNEYGVDFGYAFWQKGGNSLGINVGVNYRQASLKMTATDLSYHYQAPPVADVDGNTYIRYYEVKGMEQKINAGFIEIPVYLDYSYRITDWLGVYADAGVAFGFKCNASMKSVTGNIDTYGVYPEYEDIIIDDPYLNGFGQSSLTDAQKGNVYAKSFMASLKVGAGLEARIYGPLWFDVGVGYNYSFTNMFDKMMSADGKFNAQNAPVTYTVAEGETVAPITGYFTNSRLSGLSLNLGFSIKF